MSGSIKRMLQAVLGVELAAVMAVAVSVQRSQAPLCRRLGLQLEVWSAWPPVFIVRNVTPESTNSAIRKLAAGYLKPSLTQGSCNKAKDDGGSLDRSLRASSSAVFRWRNYSQEVLLQQLQGRFSEVMSCVGDAVAGWSRTTAEALRAVKNRLPELMQVTRYSAGEFYGAHVDNHKFANTRHATLLLYLSSLKSGHTVFPNLVPPGSQGISIKQLRETLHVGSQQAAEDSAGASVEFRNHYLRGLVESWDAGPDTRRTYNLSVHRSPYAQRKCKRLSASCSKKEVARLQAADIRVNDEGSAVKQAFTYCCCDDTLRVPADAGTALVFFPFRGAEAVLHAACPVAPEEEKWIMQQWYHANFTGDGGQGGQASNPQRQQTASGTAHFDL